MLTSNCGTEMACLLFHRDFKSGVYDIQTEHTFHSTVCLASGENCLHIVRKTNLPPPPPNTWK